MKPSQNVVTIVVIVAVFVGTCAVGLLIHRAWTGGSRSEPPTVTEVGDAQIRQDTASWRHGPGTGRTEDSPEQRAMVKEQRAQALERLNSATEEQQAQFRAQIREQFGTRPGRTGALSSGQNIKVQRQPATVQDPNAQSNGEETGVEVNTAGQN